MVVGDVHAKVENLDDCQRLIDFVKQKSEQNDCQLICFLGDLFDKMGLVNTEVSLFWEKSFQDTLSKWPIISLLGNHDYPPANPQAHALRRYSTIRVVDDFFVLGKILFIAHKFDNNEFIRICKENLHCNTVIAHAEFDGVEYENGFYAKNGLDMNLIPQKQVVTGHIHRPATLGKVWMPGSPRWLTVSDANIDRHIWVVDFNDGGEIVNKTGFSTQNVCKPIFNAIDEKLFPFEPTELHKKSRTVVDIHGDIDYVNERVEYFKQFGFRLRTFPVKNFTSEIKESEGIKKAFSKFIELYTPKYGTNRQILFDLVKEKVSWMNG